MPVASAPVVATVGRRAVRPVDVAVATGIALFCVTVGQHQELTGDAVRAADHLQILVIAVTCLPLALRRPYPLASAAVATLGCAWYVALGYTGGPVLLVPLLAMYWVGYGVDRRRGWYALVGFTVVIIGATFLPGASTEQRLGMLGWPLIAAALMLVGGGRARHDADRAARAVEEEGRQHAEARRQLAEARLQLAREMHDVVGHSLASITLLAGAGSRRVEADPSAAREVLEEIRATSASALAEVRQALAALRDPTQAVLADADHDLSRLLDRLARVGLHVDADLGVRLEELPGDVAGGLYRIAQESLTNVMRHSGSLRATLVVEPVGGGVQLSVTDRGRLGPAPIDEGIGIAGMRHRAEELGGQLSISWNEEGGLVVTAWVPAPSRSLLPERAS